MLKFFTATPMYEDTTVGSPIRIEVDTKWAGNSTDQQRDAATDIAHDNYGSRFYFKIEETI